VGHARRQKAMARRSDEFGGRVAAALPFGRKPISSGRRTTEHGRVSRSLVGASSSASPPPPCGRGLSTSDGPGDRLLHQGRHPGHARTPAACPLVPKAAVRAPGPPPTRQPARCPALPGATPARPRRQPPARPLATLPALFARPSNT
jgi:hypothetical protein